MDIQPDWIILLPIAVAAGVDLYLTLLGVAVVLLLGAGPFEGVIIPPLHAAPVLLGLGSLYLIEAAMESRPFLALLWHNLQLLLRPIGAGLLGLFLLKGEPWGFMLLGAAMAGVVAAFSHVLVWGQGLILRIVPDQRPSPRAFNFAGDLAAASLLALALARPNLGILLAIILLILGLILGGSRHGAVRFGLVLLLDRVWGIVSPTVWHPGAELPTWIREDDSFGSLDALRGAPAATWGVAGPRRFKEGWILRKNDEVLFAFRQGRKLRFVRMEGIQEKVEVGTISRTIQYREPEGASSALFLQVGLIGPESHK